MKFVVCNNQLALIYKIPLFTFGQIPDLSKILMCSKSEKLRVMFHYPPYLHFCVPEKVNFSLLMRRKYGKTIFIRMLADVTRTKFLLQ